MNTLQLLWLSQTFFLYPPRLETRGTSHRTSAAIPTAFPSFGNMILDFNDKTLEASVRAFLDECIPSTVTPGQNQYAKVNGPTTAKLKTARDTNYARNEAYRELLALRAAVPVLEHELQLRRNSKQLRVSGPDHPRMNTAASGQRWRETAESQLKQRVRVETENRRLRAQVEEARRIFWGLRSRLDGRSTSEAAKQFGSVNCWSPANLPTFDHKVKVVIEDLSRRVHAIYAAAKEESVLGSDEVLQSSDVPPIGTPTLIESGSERRLVAKRLLPFSDRRCNLGDFYYFEVAIFGYMRPRCSLFAQWSDNDSVSTVIEYFGMKMAHEDACAEFRVSQVIRKYTGASREVIIWESVVDPVSINDCRVEGGSFRETGRVLIRPHMWNESAAVLVPEYAVSEVSYAVEALTPSSFSDVADISSFILRTMALNLASSDFRIDNLLLTRSSSTTVPHPS